MTNQLSKRGGANVENIMPMIPPAILSAGWDPSSDSVIDLSMAENWLIRDEILEIQKTVTLTCEHLDLPKGFWGDPELLRSLAGFFNKSFNPSKPVLAEHIAVAPGAGGCIDALLFNICDPNDGVLIPAPFWNGYETFCYLRADVMPVLVPIPNLEDLGSFIHELENTLRTAPRPIKALLLSNPHNPLGRCYSLSQLEACLKFCQKNNIHLITDEVFGPLTFKSPDLPEEERFVSVLELDCEALGCDPSRVHMIWSPSKVFALSGVRLGCTITQACPDLHNGLALASFITVSILSSLLTTALLKSPKLEDLMAVNSQRHLQSYITITTWLKKMELPYLPCNAAPFLMAQIAPNASSWEDEAAVVQALREVDVWVSSGRGQNMPEYAKGWARLTFTLEPAKLEQALARIEPVLISMRKLGA